MPDEDAFGVVLTTDHSEISDRTPRNNEGATEVSHIWSRDPSKKLPLKPQQHGAFFGALGLHTSPVLPLIAEKIAENRQLPLPLIWSSL